MNFKRSIIVVFALGIFLFVGCSKQETEETIKQVIPEKIDGFLTYNLNKSSLAFNEEDKEDEAINWKLIEFSEKLQSSLSKPEVRREVISLVKSKGNKYVTLRELIEKIPDINSAFNSNYTDDEIYEMSHQGIIHEAVINVPNILTADYSYQPLISPGIEVEDNQSKNINDFIFSWYLNKENTYSEIIIGEAQAIEMKNPLFVVTPHPANSDITELPRRLFNHSQISANHASYRSMTPYRFLRLRVNHRYERTGSSEIWIENYRIDENGTHHWLPNSGGPSGQRELASFTKHQIGSSQFNQKTFLDPNGPQEDVAPAASNAAFFAIWERDWYSTFKGLGRMCYNNMSLNFEGERKFFSEWYSYDPNEADSGCSSGTTIQEAQINFNQASQTFNFQNNKGFVEIDYF